MYTTLRAILIAMGYTTPQEQRARTNLLFLAGIHKALPSEIKKLDPEKKKKYEALFYGWHRSNISWEEHPSKNYTQNELEGMLEEIKFYDLEAGIKFMYATAQLFMMEDGARTAERFDGHSEFPINETEECTLEAARALGYISKPRLSEAEQTNFFLVQGSLQKVTEPAVRYLSLEGTEENPSQVYLYGGNRPALPEENFTAVLLVEALLAANSELPKEELDKLNIIDIRQIIKAVFAAESIKGKMLQPNDIGKLANAVYQKIKENFAIPNLKWPDRNSDDVWQKEMYWPKGIAILERLFRLYQILHPTQLGHATLHVFELPPYPDPRVPGQFRMATTIDGVKKFGEICPPGVHSVGSINIQPYASKQQQETARILGSQGIEVFLLASEANEAAALAWEASSADVHQEGLTRLGGEHNLLGLSDPDELTAVLNPKKFTDAIARAEYPKMDAFLKEFEKNRERINLSNGEMANELLLAIARGEQDHVEKLLTEKKELINYQRPNCVEMTHVLAAPIPGSEEEAAFTPEASELTTYNNLTPLIVAIEKRHVAIVRYLLELGADIHTTVIMEIPCYYDAIYSTVRKIPSYAIHCAKTYFPDILPLLEQYSLNKGYFLECAGNRLLRCRFTPPSGGGSASTSATPENIHPGHATERASHVDIHTQSLLGRSFFRPQHHEEQEDKEQMVRCLLGYVTRGQEDDVKGLLDANLLNIRYVVMRTNTSDHIEDHVYDLSGRRFQNCSPFMYALWAMDAYMLEMILKSLQEAFHKARAKAEQGRTDEIKAAGRREMEECEAIREELIRQYHEVREQGLSYTHTQTKMVYPTVRTEDGREVPDITQPGMETSFSTRVKGEPHFNFQPLLDALATYVREREDNHLDEDARKRYWCHIVGGIQQALPVHVVNEYCHPDGSFYPYTDDDDLASLFKIGDTKLPRLLTLYNYLSEHDFPYLSFDAPNPTCRLGFDFGLVHVQGKCILSRGAPSSRASNDLAALTALCKARSQDMANLESKLLNLFSGETLEIACRHRPG